MQFLLFHASTQMYPNVYYSTQFSEISLLVFWFMHFKKICSSGILLAAVTLLEPNVHKISLCFVSVFFSYFVFDLFYIDSIYLFDTGSVLLSLSADHLFFCHFREKYRNTYKIKCYYKGLKTADSSISLSFIKL